MTSQLGLWYCVVDPTWLMLEDWSGSQPELDPKPTWIRNKMSKAYRYNIYSTCYRLTVASRFKGLLKKVCTVRYALWISIPPAGDRILKMLYINKDYRTKALKGNTAYFVYGTVSLQSCNKMGLLSYLLLIFENYMHRTLEWSALILGSIPASQGGIWGAAD